MKIVSSFTYKIFLQEHILALHLHKIVLQEAYTGSAPPPSRNSNYVDAWDSDHVRLPCSTKNVYPTKTSSVFRRKTLLSRWELIESSLLNEISSSIDLEVGFIQQTCFVV